MLNSEPTINSEFGNISEQALQVDGPVKMTITKQLKEFFSVLLLLCVFLLVNGDFSIGNLEVDSPEDGMPSLDTGLYLMSQEAPFDGYIKSVNACAFLVESNPNPQGTDEITVFFFVAGYRLMGNIFRRITDTQLFSIGIPVGEIFGCNIIKFPDQQQSMLLKGERPGVFVSQQECNQFSLQPPLYFCSAHVNLIDPIINCSQSLYFNNTSLEDGNSMPAELTAINGHPVDVFLNLDIVLESNSESLQNAEGLLEQGRPRAVCATKFESKSSQGSQAIIRTVSIVTIGVFLLLMISIACMITVVYRLKTKRRVVSNDAAIMTPDDQLILQYNTCYSPFQQGNTTLMESTHSYMISSLGLLSCAESDEELYQQPASKEEDLKYQLKNLKVNEILKDKIELKEYLGSGRFGVVYRGLLTVTGADSEGGVKEVAVKTMENGASEEDRVKFLQEAAIMGQFNNPYVVRIFGILTSDNQPYMIICEFMSKGDLHRHLHNIKIKGTLNQCEAGAMLLSYSRQVASAMVYLSGKGYVHCDLAARNILLSEDGVCKVSDFGLSRNLQDEDYYVAKSGVIPLRWTAPEAFQDGKFSTASDVWSYGVLLYEIWSLACKPYRNLTNEQIIIKVPEGHRLPSPPGCPRAIYNKMISCWHPDTSSRSTFVSVQIFLQQPDYELLKWSEEDKATYSENVRTIGATFQDGESLFTDLQTMYEVV